MVRIPRLHPIKTVNSSSFIAHSVKLNLLMTLDLTFGLDWRQAESIIEKLANRST